MITPAIIIHLPVEACLQGFCSTLPVLGADDQVLIDSIMEDAWIKAAGLRFGMIENPVYISGQCLSDIVEDKSDVLPRSSFDRGHARVLRVALAAEKATHT